MWPHAFWAVQSLSHLPAADAKLPRRVESDILPHLAWWHTAEEHLHWLHVVFDWSREYSLKLKPLKCIFFKEEITYLAHCISKEEVWPSNSNLRAIAQCMPPQAYTEVHAFLGLVGHYRRFIKRFACVAQPLNDHLNGEGASRESECVSLSEDALKAFEVLKQVCMTAPVLAFADYTKPFLLEMDASKDWLGVVLSQKQADRQYHPVTYGSRILMPHEKNYHLAKIEFLALKWRVTEHFKEYLLYQPVLVKTDNNPLTYIMMTPNLDATSHWWVGSFAWLNFELEYQKGCDNTVADVLSWATTRLDPDTVRSILNGVALGTAHWVEVHDPTMVESDCLLEQEVCVAAGHVLVQMHVTDWAKVQREDPALNAVLDWLKAQKKTDLKALLAEHASSEEGQMIFQNRQNFVIHQGALYLCSMPKGKTEDLLLFVVPKAHQVTTLNGCHRDVGHQGCDHTLSLLQEHFWWPGMINQMQQPIESCMYCLQHEGDIPKMPLHLIVATALLDLLHIDFTSIKMTMELNQLPRVANILVFHCTEECRGPHERHLCQACGWICGNCLQPIKGCPPGSSGPAIGEAQWQKWYYNQKIGAMDLKPGDLVLVKAGTFKGKRKIKDRWEHEACEVVHQIMTDVPPTKWQTNVDSHASSTKTDFFSLHQRLAFPHVWVSTKHGTDVPAQPQLSQLPRGMTARPHHE